MIIAPDWADAAAIEIERSLEGAPYHGDDIKRIAAVLRAERERILKLAAGFMTTAAYEPFERAIKSGSTSAWSA